MAGDFAGRVRGPAQPGMLRALGGAEEERDSTQQRLPGGESARGVSTAATNKFADPAPVRVAGELVLGASAGARARVCAGVSVRACVRGCGCARGCARPLPHRSPPLAGAVTDKA